MTPLDRHKSVLAGLMCVVCRRHGGVGRPVELHHVAPGSSLRTDWALIPLCRLHHDPERNGTGFHGLGTRAFCSLFRVPFEQEAGLLVWLIEDLAKYGKN